jgi:hypothetical protein
MNLSSLILIAPRHSLPLLTGMLLLAILPMPYGYYILMRLLLFMVFFTMTLRAQRERNMRGIFWLMLILTILFNPLCIVALPRPVWIPIDIVLAFMFWRIHRKYHNVSRIVPSA